MKKRLLYILPILTSCTSALDGGSDMNPYVPSAEFARVAYSGENGGVTKLNSHQSIRARMHHDSSATDMPLRDEQLGDPRYLKNGYVLQKTVAAEKTISEDQLKTDEGAANSQPNSQWQPPHPPSIPPGSRAPYYNGQMTANPSLWPDEGQGSALFKDFRAVQAMDLITIVVNESSTGKKKAETETENKFSLLAGISNFFGIETRKWAANNESLDPTQMIKADTNSKFEGSGETERSGSLKARISAVIMETLPNGLLRVEGTKILSLNSEEEIMVISGLVRQRDVTSANEVDSGRIANMRIDFYGRGLIGDEQSPGWGARLIRWLWPF